MRIAWWFFGAALAAGCSGPGSESCPNDLPMSCPSSAPGYKATIAPLMTAKCVACHSPGGLSAHYLQTWDEVHGLRGPVLDQVYSCQMPQAGGTPLTSTERADLLAWLVCGAQDD